MQIFFFVSQTLIVNVNYSNNHTEWNAFFYGECEKFAPTKCVILISCVVTRKYAYSQPLAARILGHTCAPRQCFRIQSTWHECLIHLYYRTSIEIISNTWLHAIHSPAENSTTQFPELFPFIFSLVRPQLPLYHHYHRKLNGNFVSTALATFHFSGLMICVHLPIHCIAIDLMEIPGLWWKR